ncbi:MAG: hypothetical protein IT443_01525 [Phycisphaeraceae bacterium]|nr:hypothetical protein [Phycisphaeraceae bacterium]
MPLEIRELVPEDFKALIQFWSKARDPNASAELNDELLWQVQRRFPGLSLVAMNEQGVTGCILVQGLAHDGGLIYRLLLKPEERQSPLARELVDKAFRKLSYHNFHKCHIHREDGTDIKPFWETSRWQQQSTPKATPAPVISPGSSPGNDATADTPKSDVAAASANDATSPATAQAMDDKTAAQPAPAAAPVDPPQAPGAPAEAAKSPQGAAA